MMRNWFERSLTPEDEQAVAAFMRRLAINPPHQRPTVGDSNLLWWKGQLLRRWDAERKVTVPLDVAEPIEIGVGLATAALVLAWLLPSLTRVLVP